MGYDWLYYLRKAYALYPGVIRPASAGILREHYERRRRARTLARRLADVVAGVLFHLWIPWRAWRVQKRFGYDAAWRRRATALAHRGFVDPNDIALFRVERASQLATLLRRFEDAPLNKQLNPLGWTRNCVLADKRRFAERCRSAGLPHPSIVALVESGRIRMLEDPGGRELVAKPALGEGGSGFRLLGAVADATALQAKLAQSRGPLLVQPRLYVHPSLQELALAALPTARIVTMRDEKGQPEIVGAAFRFARDPGAAVDNMKAGGLIAGVDLESGRLGLACTGYTAGDYSRHPVSGTLIEGRELPDWRAARALAVRAHDAFADYVVIGWDVALTSTGPVLIEGNGKPSLLLLQRSNRHGLAQGRYGALLAHNLALSHRAETCR
jgi:hypothetical protein